MERIFLILIALFAGLNLDGQVHLNNAPPSNLSEDYLAAKEEGDQIRESKALIRLALHYSETGNYNLSEKFNWDALRLAIRIHYYKDIGITLNNLSLTYRYRGNYERSFELCALAIRVEEMRGDKGSLSLSYYNFAAVLSDAGDYPKSLEYIEKAIELDRKNEKYADLAANVVLKGLALVEMGETETAIDQFKLAIEFYEGKKDTLLLAMCYSNIGYAQNRDSLNWEALENFRTALSFTKTTKDLRGLAISNNNLADQFLTLGQFDSAQYYADIGLQVATQIGKKPTIRDIYAIKADIARGQGDYRAALENLDSSLALKDEILNAENIAKIEELEAKYKKEKQERDLKIKQQQILLLERETQVANIILYAVIGGFITLAFLVLMFVRSRRRKRLHELAIYKKEQELELEKRARINQELKSEVEYKNREVENLAQNIVQKNDLLQSLRQEIKAGSRTPSRVIQAISVVMDNDKEEFEQRVDNIHSLFYKKVKEQFPKLNDNDLRLLSLVKMKMSSKDMAILLNINPASVDVARYRLKKKMDLPKETNLIEFLEQL